MFEWKAEHVPVQTGSDQLILFFDRDFVAEPG